MYTANIARDRVARDPEEYADAWGTPQAGGTMESRTHCAYNVTRECFLGLDVTAANLSYAGGVELMTTIRLKPGEGLWLTPYRGLPTSGLEAPLDLVYLDAAGIVLETVEAFPTVHDRAPMPEAASALALPLHSIFSSQTQAGDQLLVCAVEEMEQELERITNPRNDVRTSPRNEALQPLDEEQVVQSAVLLREQPLWSGGPGVLELGERALKQPEHPEPAYEIALAEPGKRTVRSPRNWLERWWSPDPRKAPRESEPGLAAYYWNGAPPRAHEVRDISASGLYVVTEERWYPGTLVLMTLQRTDCGEEEVEERSIAVQSRAVRWGNDGVGLQFVLPEPQNRREAGTFHANGADRKALERFLNQIRKSR